MPRVPRMAKRGTPTASLGRPHLAGGCRLRRGTAADDGRRDPRRRHDRLQRPQHRRRLRASAHRQALRTRRWQHRTHTWSRAAAGPRWIDLTADEDGNVFVVYTKDDGLEDNDLRSSHYLASTGVWSNPTLGPTPVTWCGPRSSGATTRSASARARRDGTDYNDSHRAKYALAVRHRSVVVGGPAGQWRGVVPELARLPPRRRDQHRRLRRRQPEAGGRGLRQGGADQHDDRTARRFHPGEPRHVHLVCDRPVECGRFLRHDRPAQHPLRPGLRPTAQDCQAPSRPVTTSLCPTRARPATGSGPRTPPSPVRAD